MVEVIKVGVTQSQEEVFVWRIEQEIARDRYILEIVAQKDRWPRAVDKIHMGLCLSLGSWGGYMCRTITLSFPDTNMEIEIMQTRINAETTGVDLDIRFVIPVIPLYRDHKDIVALPQPVLRLVRSVDTGGVNKHNLANTIKSFVKDLREYIVSLTNTYVVIS